MLLSFHINVHGDQSDISVYTDTGKHTSQAHNSVMKTENIYIYIEKTNFPKSMNIFQLQIMLS